MQFIDADQVHALGDFPSLIDALNRFHREEKHVMEDLMLTQSSPPAEDNYLLIRAAWQPGLAMGIKLVTGFPGNPDRHPGLPAVQAVVVLFDGVDGKPCAVVDGTALTYRKTAADSALGSRYLSRSQSKTMLMVGAGALARYMVEAHLAVRPRIDTVKVWNRTGERATALVKSLADRGLKAAVVDDLDSVAGEVNLICCATSSARPLIHGEWLQPGTHVDLVGAFTPERREADDEVLRRSSIFVDARSNHALGELMIPMANGVITEMDILADLYDLAGGIHPGRRDDEEITVFKNGGGGHLDLMTARFLLERANG